MGSVFRWLGLLGVAQVIGLASPSAWAGAALPLEITAADPDGAAALVGAPISAPVTLSASQLSAASAGRLSLKEKREHSQQEFPVQFEPSRAGEGGGRLWWLMPEGAAGSRNFLLQELPDSAPALQTGSGEVMRAIKNSATGQYEIRQAGKPVLGYNYQTNHPGELLAKIHPDNLKYARPRGDYIHPLFGLDGEELTKDWSVDHPHHRGIYWAWPEVDYHGERGDLHALQRVFARPTGNVALRNGPVFAQIEAENLWLWEDREPIVRERTIIRAYRETPLGRCVDLEFQFTALKDEVAIARRGTEHYGGLNLRFSAVKEQDMLFHTDAPDVKPRMAWAGLSGTFPGGRAPLGVSIFQRQTNPAYPGDWIKYPELNWLQPTFPAAGARWVLKPRQPLVLRFRLWLHRGGKASEDLQAAQWRAYNYP